MKKIKPEVIGYRRIMASGVEGVLRSKSEMIIGVEAPFSNSRPFIHPNGKQKFRPVYKKDAS